MEFSLLRMCFRRVGDTTINALYNKKKIRERTRIYCINNVENVITQILDVWTDQVGSENEQCESQLPVRWMRNYNLLFCSSTTVHAQIFVTIAQIARTTGYYDCVPESELRCRQMKFVEVTTGIREREISDLKWVDREGWEKRKLIYFKHRNMWKHQESVYK